MSSVDELLAKAREQNPDLWKRTDDIARIIDPGAFLEGPVTTEPPELADNIRSKLAYQRAVAEHKAHEILKYLGVNMDVDWFSLLDAIHKTESESAAKAQEEAQ